MKHYGDITKIDGHKVPLVDIVTGGSPCQDLSVAGKRAGLDGERSGLFMEQVRIVKEMRDESRQLCMQGANEYIRPRYLVWENVPGAFSSNKGEDFRCVLEEIAKVADENAVIPGLTGNAKWSNAGLILGDGYSIAWRLHDLQYFGCPQRRKRICVLADFDGDTAGKILFELRRETSDGETEQTVGDIGIEPQPEVSAIGESVCRNLEQSEQAWEEVAGSPGAGIEESDSAYTLKIRGGGR
jgi:DNA (cytosine-5)-methyltransferase 1